MHKMAFEQEKTLKHLSLCIFYMKTFFLCCINVEFLFIFELNVDGLYENREYFNVSFKIQISKAIYESVVCFE